MIDYEVSLLKLIDQITNGTKVDINVTGTKVKISPGVITNAYGKEIDFECSNARAVSYYLEAIIPFVIFGKVPLRLRLRGVTNNDIDLPVNIFINISVD